jgi:hypothetical protein
MTEHAAGASRIFVTGASVASTLLLVGAISHDTHADAAAKAHRHAVAMREWNDAQTQANAAELRWVRENPEIEIRTIRRTRYVPIVVPVGGSGDQRSRSGGSSESGDGHSTSESGSSGSGSGPAPGAPSESPRAEPPEPVADTGGSSWSE